MISFSLENIFIFQTIIYMISIVSIMLGYVLYSEYTKSSKYSYKCEYQEKMEHNHIILDISYISDIPFKKI